MRTDGGVGGTAALRRAAPRRAGPAVLSSQALWPTHAEEQGQERAVALDAPSETHGLSSTAWLRKPPVEAWPEGWHLHLPLTSDKY